MTLLLEDKLDTWLVEDNTRAWGCGKVNSESLLNHFKGISQGLFTITSDSEDTVEVSTSWGELVEPIMLVIETIMLSLVISLKGVGHVLPHAVVEDIIGECLGSKLAWLSVVHIIIN